MGSIFPAVGRLGKSHFRQADGTWLCYYIKRAMKTAADRDATSGRGTWYFVKTIFWLVIGVATMAIGVMSYTEGHGEVYAKYSLLRSLPGWTVILIGLLIAGVSTFALIPEREVDSATAGSAPPPSTEA